MKFKFLAIATIALAQLAAPSVQASDEIVQSICAYVAADNKNNLRKALSDNRLRLRNMYDGISCDGLPLVRHAMKHKANDAAEFIIKQLPGSYVQQSGDLEWAASNGFADSPIIATIKERIAS